METITFKLNDDQMNELVQRAEQWNNKSCHLYAKRIVLDHLADAERTRIRKEVADLRRDMIRLREALATAAAALLVKAGKVSNTEEAEAWAQRELL